jgi:hypothetical protein
VDGLSGSLAGGSLLIGLYGGYYVTAIGSKVVKNGQLKQRKALSAVQ